MSKTSSQIEFPYCGTVFVICMGIFSGCTLVIDLGVPSTHIKPTVH